MMNRAGIANNDRVRGNIAVDKSPWSDQDIIPDSNLANDRGVNANTHTATDGGDALAGSPAFCPNRHPFMKVAIVAKNSIPVHGNIVGVAQIKPLSNPGATRNLNPVFPRMKPEQGFVNGSGNRVFPGLSLPEKEMPYPQIP